MLYAKGIQERGKQITSGFIIFFPSQFWQFCRVVLSEVKRKNWNCLRALARVFQFYRSELRTTQNGQTAFVAKASAVSVHW